MTDFPDREQGKRCLLEIADVLDQYEGLDYFLIQGTALGAYRDSGFTPTERDIDFGFLQEQFSPLAPDLAADFTRRGWEIETIVRPFSVCRTIVVSKYGWRADLVSFSRWRDKRFANAPIVPLKKRACGDYAIVHDASLLETWEKVHLFGREFSVPSPIETYLRCEYDNWKIPTEDHVSRTRIYKFLASENIPHDYLTP